MKNGLEVFDFKEEDEIAEYAAGKILVSQGSDGAKKEIDTVPRVDVDAMECENSSKDDTSCVPLGMAREDSTTIQDNSAPDATIESKSASHEKVPCSEIDNIEPKSFIEQETMISCHEALSPGKVQSNRALVDSPSNVHSSSLEKVPCSTMDNIEPKSFIEQETMISCHEALSPGKVQSNRALVDSPSNVHSSSLEKVPCSTMDNIEPKSFIEQETMISRREALSPGKVQSNCAPVDSPSNSEPVNEKSDCDRITNESSPSSSASDMADDGAIENDLSSDKYFSASEMDIIDMAVDYVVYRDNYCTGCLITFSCGGIKVSGMPAYGDVETFNFERAIDDIIRIESQHLQRAGTVTVKLHVLSKDVAQAANAYGVEQLEFAVGQLNWSAKLEEIASLNVKYLALSDVVHGLDVTLVGGEELHRQRPYFPIFDAAVEDVVYPKGDSDAVSISKRDFDLLQPETFINDNVIDFYIKYLKNQIPAEERNKFHFFNSFFFRKLADLDKDPSSASDGRAAFLRVHKWTRKVDIFGKDYVFIPVNFNLHWSLLVICHPGEVASFKDEDLGKSPRVPCILHMDSIKGTHAGLKNLVQSYLWEEWKSRNKETSEDLSSKFLNLRFVPLELPQQENSFDCGLFLLHYLELFLAEVPPNFSPFKINEFSKFLNVDWFPPAEAYLKRTLIQRLISGLIENRSNEHSSRHCSDEPDCSFLENNEKETRVQFVPERCTQAVACHGNLSGSDATQGIEITLLESSSMRNTDCASDSGMVLRELFDTGVAAGSLLAECPSFDQPSYYRPNGSMSQQLEQDVAEPGEQFMYFPTGDSIYQQISGLTPQAGSVPYSLRGFADSSWNAGISMQGKDDVSSPETSACDSDDSDVGIIENCSIVEDVDLSQNDKTGQQRSQSMENIECLTERLASGSDEILETSAINGVDDTTENGDLALCQEIPSTLHKDTNEVENGLKQHYVKAEISGDFDKAHKMGDDMTLESEEKQTLGNNVMEKSNEKQTLGDNMMAKSDENQTLGDNVMAESDEKQMVSENGMAVSDEKQTLGDNVMAKSDEKQMVSENGMAESESNENQTPGDNVMTKSDEKQMVSENGMAESDENQTLGDNVMAASDEKQTPGDIAVAVSDEEQTLSCNTMAVSGEDQSLGCNAVAVSGEDQSLCSNAMAASDEDQSLGHNVVGGSDEKRSLSSNAMAVADERQIINDNTKTDQSDEEEQAAKRRRVTPPHEGEGDDLHL